MTVDANLVAKAVELLRNRKVAANDTEGAKGVLADYDEFNDLGQREFDALVADALAQMRAAPAPRPARGAGGASAGPARKLPEYKSPFVFVTLADEVVIASAATAVDIPIGDGYCATLSYELEAETPLLVGGEPEGPADEGTVVPMRFGAAGNYVIPGATVRGLIRSAVEIVAYGRLGSANLHHRFGIRDFEHPYYENVATVGRVQAGWLTGEAGADDRIAMRITPCDWAHVLIDDMAADPQFRGKVTARETWIGNALRDKYAALGMAAGRAPIDFAKSFHYGPAFDDNGRSVRKPAPRGAAGVPVFSGKLPGRGGNKKYEYAFFDRAGATPVDIEPDLVEDFIRLNSKPSKNRPAPDGSWKELKPTFDAGRRIPVFFVGDLATRGRDFFFGLTRMLKVPHRRSVRQVLDDSQRAHLAEWRDGYSADFVENLFGYVVEPKDFAEAPGTTSPGSVARKGRIAFSFAHLAGGPGAAALSAPVAVVQSAPRASFSPFYLKPGQAGKIGAEADYSAEVAPRLAGRKRYMPREARPDVQGRLGRIGAMGERQREAIRGGPGGRDPSADLMSRLRFLVPARPAQPLVFHGEIRLHNVTAAELGAVLFALAHGGDPGKPYRHMIGRAKPFGAGQVRLRSLRLMAEANSGAEVADCDAEERLSEDARTGFSPPPPGGQGQAKGLKPFLTAFVAHMRGQRGLGAFPNVAPVLEFLGASDPANGAAREADLDYMPLGDFNPLRRATKPLKNPEPPATPASRDGRLLGAPAVRTPRFWT